jgi:Restriction endonuclease
MSPATTTVHWGQYRPPVETHENDGMEDEDSIVDRWAMRYPPAEMSFDEFERFVTELLGVTGRDLEDFRVTPHEIIRGVDGEYDFDITVRFRVLGLEFLVIGEAKRHANSIKRELVQVLHDKATSVGAHKAVLISTAPFQRGAIKYAKVHGIALVYVTEGRFTWEARSRVQPEPLTREEAAARGTPTFVGVHFGRGESPNATSVALIGPGDSERVRELLLDVVLAPPES